MGQPRPYRKGGGAAALHNFCGFLSIYAYTLCHSTTKLDVVTYGEGLIFEGQPRLPSQESGAPQFLVFSCIYANTL